MKKVLTSVVLAILVAIPAFAETDYVSMEVIEAIRDGKNTKDQIQTLRVKNNATIGGNVTVAAAGEVTCTPVASVNVTNGQAVTLSGVINLLKGIDGTNNALDTVTLANPSAAGQLAIVFNATGATNRIGVALTGSFVGPALELSAGESAILFAPSATNWAGIGQ